MSIFILALALGETWSARAQPATNCAVPPPSDQIRNPVSLTPVSGSPNSFLKATIANAPPGYAVTNGDYAGWSIDYTGSLLLGNVYQPILYYSYGDLPVSLQDPLWHEVNYVLNHKQGNATDIQNAIWYFIGGPVVISDPNGYFPPSATAVNLIVDAINHGSGFVPGPGQVSAVVLDFGAAFQTSLIEVTCPTARQNLASVGNYVWEDLNHNGVQENGEPGLAGVVVQLYTSAGAPAGNTVTDGSGSYSFDPVAPGNYFVKFLAPSGYYYTLPGQGSDETKDSDADGSGRTTVFTLGTRQHDATRDAGLFRTAALGDLVWYDLNKDGLQDTIEPGVANVVVILEDCLGNQVVRTTTDPFGFYLFFNLLPGNYQIHFVPGPPFLFTAPDVGRNDALDSDANPITGLTPCLRLISGRTNRTVNAGLVTAGDVSFEFTVGADKATVSPGGSVTYTYRVLNTGTMPLVNLVITDDNATPGVPGDDFTAGTIPSLIPGALLEFTHTSMVPPVAAARSVCLTNIARLTAQVEASTLTRAASAQVCVINHPPPRNSQCPEKDAFYIRNQATWPSPYAPSQRLQSVFAKASLYPDAGPRSLLQALQGHTHPSKVKELLKHGVNALLNSARPEVSFSFTTAQVISAVNRALMSGKDSELTKTAEALKKANDKQKGCKSKSPPKPAASLPTTGAKPR